MLHVGLTGGIGSGKSTIAAFFSGLGAVTMDADLMVREMLAPGGIAVEAVVDAFGEEVLRPDGGVNRPLLAERVFVDHGAREALEKLIHPMVFSERRKRIEAIRKERGDEVIIVTEAALIFEAGAAGEFDAVVLVILPEEARKARLLVAGWAPEDVDKRMAAQLPNSTKVPLADYLIDNGGSLAKTREEVGKLWRELKALAVK